ncbi:MAG: GMC family oxidoreductase [Bermanella sp.]
MAVNEFDFDQVIIGSGFGGSCSALRLSEKGHKVLVLEKGQRWKDEDFPKTNLNLKRYVWAPLLGLKGLNQVSLTKKFIGLHGAGVGGGSLVYGNVHLIPSDEVFNSDNWQASNKHWKEDLLPFYGLAQRMIGVAKSTYENSADLTLKAVAEDLGKGSSYDTVNTGILFPLKDKNGKEKLGEERGDPYFNGDGPQRKSCEYCANCLSGCRHSAKNTLVKNYLYFAERNGVEVRAESKVTRIQPLGNGTGEDGYEITIKDISNYFRSRIYTIKTQGVVLSAGVMGTVPLLLKQKMVDKTLPNISDELGRKIRTNSETLIPVSTRLKDAQGKAIETCEGPSISSIISPDDETNIEIVRYGKGSDFANIGMVTMPLTDNNGPLPRVIQMLFNIVKNPIKAIRTWYPLGKAKNTVWLLVMQKKEAFVHFEFKRRWYKGFINDWEAVQKEGDSPLTALFPIAQKVARMFTKKTNGDASNILGEIVADTPITAHIMSGVAMGSDASNGVIDKTGKVFGYKNLRVLDGSIIPGNMGVNPSLTILALTEHAMSKLPVFNKERADTIKPVLFSSMLEGQVSQLTGSGDLATEIKLKDVS